MKSWRVVGKRNIFGQNHSYLRCPLWRKTEYIKGIAEKVANVEFNPDDLKKLLNEEVIEQSKKFRGVGIWTAELILCTGLKRNGVFPADDLGVRRAVSKLRSDNRSLSGNEVRELNNRCVVFKRYVICYLICAFRS